MHSFAGKTLELEKEKVIEIIAVLNKCIWRPNNCFKDRL